MNKNKPTDDECIRRLLEPAKALVADGASVFDIMMAFGDVALTLAKNKDPASTAAQLEIVSGSFSACAGAARLEYQRLTGKDIPQD